MQGSTRFPVKVFFISSSVQGTTMSTFRSRKVLVPLLAFLLLDLLAVGAGMGVPIFAIFFGFLVGWLAPRVLAETATDLRSLLRKCVAAALLTSTFTFLLMLLIWGPKAAMLFDPAADIAHFGIPLILYEPVASFVGWIVLMVFLSPFLQALAAAFASSVRLAWFPPKAVLQTS
jgi:hypothetical protein